MTPPDPSALAPRTSVEPRVVRVDRGAAPIHRDAAGAASNRGMAGRGSSVRSIIRGSSARVVRRVAGALLLAATGVALVVLALSLGERVVPPADVLAALLGRSDAATQFLVTDLRGPRVLGAVVVGACLGMSGAITQSMMRNPLASPDIVGVTAGACCAAVVVILAGGTTGGFGTPGSISVPAAACLGGILAGVFVVLLSWRGGIEPRRVVLVGLGVNAGFGALTSWVLLRADLPDLTTAMIWLTGSLSAVDAKTLRPSLLGGSACLALAAVSTRTLGLLRFGEVTVRALGVDITTARVLQALLAVVAASLAAAVGGPIAFIAFCAPQIATILFGTDGPPALGGAAVGVVLVLAADLVARAAFPQPLPVGLVTSFCGGPILLWLLTRGAARSR